MKRFFCTVCNKVVRVRRLPRAIQTPQDTPANRIGKCNFHQFNSKAEYISAVSRVK